MASLSLSLPPPRKTGAPRSKSESDDEEAEEKVQGAVRTPQNSTTAKPLRAPTYEARCAMAAAGGRAGSKPFVPRSLADFDDGGAFPEIHVAQYPRHMGNPHVKKAAPSVAGAAAASNAIVNVELDAQGNVSYDALVKGGTNAHQQVFSRHSDLVVKGAPGAAHNQDDVALPTEEEVQAEAARTQAAFDALINKKSKLDKPAGSAMEAAGTSQNQVAQTQFIQYTPRPDAPGYNPAAAQRVIQMVPKQVDPMAPPKHKHIKAPRGPADDFVPVLHAPPTKLSKEERQAWNIPACISNWKNTRGYTIPLDKRLAADGRGLRDNSTVSENFATLAESLYVAEQQARQQVKLRATVAKQQALQAKEQREQELRALAQQARAARGGALAAVETVGSSDEESENNDLDKDHNFHGSETPPHEPKAPPVVPHDDDDNDNEPEDTPEDVVAARQRERLRQARKREREKELRLEQSMQAKRARLEEERDVSEKIALGQHQGHATASDQVDARLYNQSGGLDSGFGAEDDYNTYTKPLFERQAAGAGSIYRPTRGEADYYNADEQYDKLKNTSKFAPQKGFAGAEGGMDVQAGPRTAPVQFEKGESK